MRTKEQLYQSVKFVDGEDSVTIEDTNQLTSDEMMMLCDYLINDPEVLKANHLTILLNDRFSEEVERHMQCQRFKCQDELIFFRKDLTNIEEHFPLFKLRALRHMDHDQFAAVWERSMRGSLNAPSTMTIDEQMRNVKKELGPTYLDTCIIAYERDEAVGVVMPHIEPGTPSEGRIFYFGLVPEVRGQKKSVPLYWQGLNLLKKNFGANYSVGATSVHNKPMLEVFKQTKCTATGKVKVYKRVHGGKKHEVTYHR